MKAAQNGKKQEGAGAGEPFLRLIIDNRDRWPTDKKALAFAKAAERLVHDGRWDTVLDACECMIEIEPDYRWAHLVRVWALTMLDRNGGALAAADHAVEAGADLAVVHGLRARALFCLGRFPEALAAADECGKLKPDWVWPHSSRAGTLAALGRSVEARAAIDRAAELAPDEFKPGLPSYRYREELLKILSGEARAVWPHENADIVESEAPGYTGKAPPSSPADTPQKGMRDDFNVQIKQARTEVLARMLDLDNPALSESERLRRARRVKASFERRRAEDPDFPASPEVQKAISIINRHNYQNAKVRKAKAKLAM